MMKGFHILVFAIEIDSPAILLNILTTMSYLLDIFMICHVLEIKEFIEED